MTDGVQTLRRPVVALLLLFLAGPAWAAGTATSAGSLANGRCLASSSSALTAQQCQTEELKRADDALNAAYRRLQGVIDPELKPRLVKAERAWIAFRDAECAYAGPPGRPGDQDACIVRETTARAHALQHYVDAENGGYTP